MSSKSLKLPRRIATVVGGIMLAAILMTSNVLAVSRVTGPNDNPANAQMFDLQTHALTAGQAQWYRLNLAGRSGEYAILRLPGASKSGLQFEIYSTSQLNDWMKQDPLGVGNVEENGDLAWASQIDMNSNNDLYVRILNNNTQCATYQFTLTGASLSNAQNNSGQNGTQGNTNSQTNTQSNTQGNCGQGTASQNNTQGNGTQNGTQGNTNQSNTQGNTTGGNTNSNTNSNTTGGTNSGTNGGNTSGSITGGINSEPSGAMLLDTNMHTLSGGQSQWYCFSLPDSRGQFSTLSLPGMAKSGLQFEIYPANQINSWRDQDPIGRSNADDNGDLVWGVQSDIRSSFYLRVINGNADMNNSNAANNGANSTTNANTNTNNSSNNAANGGTGACSANASNPTSISTANNNGTNNGMNGGSNSTNGTNGTKNNDPTMITYQFVLSGPFTAP